MRRDQAVARVAARLDDQLAVTANGHIARELFAAGDRDETFYMLGSMGLAAPIALGLALSRPQRRVVVFDGDGNLLMGLGHLAMIGERRPANLCHFVFDNSSYASTGGQRAISDGVALERLASAAGYRHADRLGEDGDLERAVDAALVARGPSLLVVPVSPGNQPGMPRVKPTPPEITARLRRSTGADPP